jgi:hypothetical protein
MADPSFGKTRDTKIEDKIDAHNCAAVYKTTIFLG